MSKRTVHKTSSHKEFGSPAEDICTETGEHSVEKSIELEEDFREKLTDFPEVLLFIEKLQNIIRRQAKKISKWKLKARQLADKETKNESTQTSKEGESNGEYHPEVEGKSIAETIREAAEEASKSSGFVYEETSGLYYDYNSGYYYNAEYGLYYDGSTGTYLTYNQETQTYDFHSQVVAPDTQDKEHNIGVKKRSKKERKPKAAKRQRRKYVSHVDQEEGECSCSSNSSDEDSSVSNSSDTGKQWPPCVRLVVESTDIPKIKAGTLFIITRDGGTVGREGDQHAICLPDINVSKHHLKVSYDGDLGKYTIVDLGSRNGTLLNGKRVSSSKQESDPMEIVHGSRIQLGSTCLLCHIHEGSQTCGQCEPGLLIVEEKDPLMTRGRHDVKQQFKSEMKRLKKQHGLIGSGEEPGKLGQGYTDRAQKRRIEVGSQNPYEKTKTASVNESIPSENKGFKLLSKMGWQTGQSLGKDGTGLTEPINVTSNVGTSGIGATPSDAVPLIASSNGTSKENIWKKTQERFGRLPDTVAASEDNVLE